MNAEMMAFNPEPGVAELLETNVRRVLAPNPSPMTFRGTNTYLIGSADLAVIDPGPDISEHLQCILNAVEKGQRISHIVVTHAHLDHSPLAKALSNETGAPIYAFGGPNAGRSAVMSSLAQTGLVGGGEGVDTDFVPDVIVGDGDVLSGSDWHLEVLHTPGHFGNHIALAMQDICFVGDHVMGWASSLVSPPDGDLTDFMASCQKLRGREWRVFHSGHGAPVINPDARLDWLMDHRKNREHEILTCLSKGPANADSLARQIYTETPPMLLAAAARNVLAHLIDLTGKKIVQPQKDLSATAIFELR